MSLYLVPGHGRLLVGCEIVVDVRAADHFALGDLGVLLVSYPAAEAESLLALLHRQRHGHLHTVRGVPAKHTKPTPSTSLTETANVSFALEKAFKRSLFDGDQRERDISRSHYDSESLFFIAEMSL